MPLFRSGDVPYFLATSKHFYTIRLFRERVSGGRTALTPGPYETLLSTRRRIGGIIIGDIDRLIGPTAQQMGRFAERMQAQLPSGAVLNHPTRSMRRYELLRNLHARGINSFNVYRLSEAREPSHYPVFVRRDSGHDGAASDPLPGRHALDREIQRMLAQGAPRDAILIVEYLDYQSPDGMFRKYGAYLIGDRFIPFQIEIADKWVVKVPTIVTPETVEEEMAYVGGGADGHEALLRDVFAMANIQYGRIDYTLVDGRPQIFEINTNPVILGPRSKVRERRPIFNHVMPRIRRAFDAIDAVARARSPFGRRRKRWVRGGNVATSGTRAIGGQAT